MLPVTLRGHEDRVDSTTYDTYQFPVFMVGACDKVSRTLNSNEHPGCKK